MEGGKIRIVESGRTASMQKAEQIAHSKGKNIVFFVGENLKLSTDGTHVTSARALFDADTNTIYARVDHPVFDVDVLVAHEAGHVDIDNGDVDVQAVSRWLLDRFGMKKLEKMISSRREKTGR